ncbi:phosphonate ABC transporter ATP-binding protein [Marinobacter sp. M3C]|uniref:phosphonate ABC transporter ATP-binding protein n=1 Tax=Marinobacter sp. M3C TaxID=2917715 RepID=UPI0032C44859
MASVQSRDTMLRIEDVGVTYPGNVLALRPTTVEFHKGEFTVLLGLSGAGKSSLLRALNHLVLPTTGTVISAEFGALNTQKTVRQHRCKTAMVFQHHQLIERHTALQNVLTGRLAYQSTWRSLFPQPRHELELALHCLDRVGLADKALARADQLSGGQQQRVGIARALAQQPSMILADEPVASLDPATSERVLTLLKDICREDGITAVISLHQLDYAQRFADRIIGLANARIVFDAAPAQLKQCNFDDIYHCASESAPAHSEPTAPQPTNRATNYPKKQLEIAQ